MEANIYSQASYVMLQMVVLGPTIEKSFAKTTQAAACGSYAQFPCLCPSTAGAVNVDKMRRAMNSMHRNTTSVDSLGTQKMNRDEFT